MIFEWIPGDFNFAEQNPHSTVAEPYNFLPVWFFRNYCGHPTLHSSHGWWDSRNPFDPTALLRRAAEAAQAAGAWCLVPWVCDGILHLLVKTCSNHQVGFLTNQPEQRSKSKIDIDSVSQWRVHPSWVPAPVMARVWWVNKKGPESTDTNWVPQIQECCEIVG